MARFESSLERESRREWWLWNGEYYGNRQSGIIEALTSGDASMSVEWNKDNSAKPRATGATA
jgi:hypothetical protein